MHVYMCICKELKSLIGFVRLNFVYIIYFKSKVAIRSFNMPFT